ncbi:hypothetical protein [Haloechinothrix sp. LS1_15]|uniref:hypothetical protein n=1 Tax=Haloechinothrix sp. LS1_15 TaxID=2652248 RepID=UPI002947B09B|nr:hypothetical protein [Haloechinothrix sp. LS1_15]MDV6014393.1 hypothetical protein [Haloechinothrix sp. LS1_15]
MTDDGVNLDDLFAQFTGDGAVVVARSYGGRIAELPDGTLVGLRKRCRSGLLGTTGHLTLDLFFPDGRREYVRVPPE